MGMTDRQFDAYQESLLRELKRALEELKESGVTNKILEEVVESMERQLQRP